MTPLKMIKNQSQKSSLKKVKPPSALVHLKIEDEQVGSVSHRGEERSALEATGPRRKSSGADSKAVINLETVKANVFIKNQSADLSNRVRVGYHKL